MTSKTLTELASLVGATVKGDGNKEVARVATLDNAGPDHISFLANSKYRKQLDHTAAGAVILSEADSDAYSGNALIAANPYVCFARIAQILDTTPMAADCVHPSAVIDASARLGTNVTVAANAVIEADAVIGDNVQIGAGSVVGRGAHIGQGTRLWANVTLYHGVELGQDCIIHSGAVIGSDGFGYANEAGQWIKIPQVGSVRIGNRVEIGSNTSIDRGAIDDTVIEDGVIIDNLCQIAHNDIIGAHTAIAGCSVIAGSTKIGRHCIIGGNSAIAGHIELADGVQITGMSRVSKGLREAGVYSSGSPIQDNKSWRRNSVRMRQLDDMHQRLRELEKQLPDSEQDQ
ncbi:MULTISPECIES: UDP-3-O-(3-hydroxymyristoyl)glucosamine N-acyltransferase [Ferrimonas]|uniref:UDP-3-O-(3-hydroxymyristoyl)glucosamine N-acyltransferase n=1 Tax=Ferrimonas TaxID=44011 RepID=UPI000425EC29|nr:MULTISPECIES: UDP-3-O-(3-hydroxymyristoyl)glucosamine N-acyltransferase [Ferrimonas]USD36765.1 UDP-3-O-(3-hydroxymyristoyl)glucosamine N-acyltransferase [Ferrimonas sp. SCSIO 43195]